MIHNSAYYRKRVQTNKKRREALVKNYKKSIKKLTSNVGYYSRRLNEALKRESIIRSLVKKTGEFFDVNIFRLGSSRNDVIVRDFLFKYALENKVSSGAISIYLKMDISNATKRRIRLNRQLKINPELREQFKNYSFYMKD